MSNRYGGGGGGGASPPNGNGYGGLGTPGGGSEDYDPYGNGYNDDRYGGGGGSVGRRSPRAVAADMAPPPPPSSTVTTAARTAQLGTRMRSDTTSAEQQITQVLEHIKTEWPSMYESDCLPVQLALQLLDSSSVGRAHEYAKFQQTHMYLQESLKNIVHEHHQGFNSSIGTFHKIQSSIHASQKRVRALKESLAAAKTSLCTTDPELKKLSSASNSYDELLQTLNELDDLRTVPDQLEARISEKRFLTAVEVLQSALRKLRKPELDNIGALTDLRSYLSNQETALMDILVEELHEHLYLKSPYCQDRWQNLTKTQSSSSQNDAYGDGTSAIVPFHAILDSVDIDSAAAEDPMKNPEADTFYYVTLLVEALNRLGRLQNAVETLKQRLPVELFGIVNETINEVDQRHPSSLRGSTNKGDGLLVYGTRETQMRGDVIHDLLWTLFGKFEAIGEGHRVFHEAIKALIRREGAGNNSALLGSFKELWNLYQNEIRSLLHNYVTTDADVYQFDSPMPGATLNGKKDAAREHLFKFSELDPRSVDMETELEALENIIQATVPGLTSGSSRRSAAEGRKNRSAVDEGSSRRGGGGANGGGPQPTGTYKALVEPSVFNMSLLLPPTLVFLQRLKGIVPPGSDLATSALTTFLDNFLVNVFQPQLEETLAKLSDGVFGEVDAFTQDPHWSQVARRPVFKGTTAFLGVVTAFCRMLGTIPPDQALSSLIVTQMMRYYDRCFSWFKSLVTKTTQQDPGQQQQQQQQDPQAATAATAPTDSRNLRASARFAVEPGELHQTMQDMWTTDKADAAGLAALAEKEIRLLMEQTNESKLEAGDIIQDSETISLLCLLYTSMKWLAGKISSLRHITTHDADSARHNAPREASRRWTLMNDAGGNTPTEQQRPVYLPLTAETVQGFDSIVSSFEELAQTALLTLHMEMRCRIVHSLRTTLSPELAPYLLEQEVTEPDPHILSLNSELVVFDETASRYLRERETAFIRGGVGLLINDYLVGNAWMASPMNAKGCGRMQLNVLVLQQNLKNIEQGVDLARASNYFALFDAGPDQIVAAATAGGDGDRFSREELSRLLELYFSEEMADPERGIAGAARRSMDDKMQALAAKY